MGTNPKMGAKIIQNKFYKKKKDKRHIVDYQNSSSKQVTWHQWMIISKYLRYVTAETRKEFQWLQFENTVNVKAKKVSSCIAKKRSNAFGKLSCIFLSYEFGKPIGFISSLSMNMVVLGDGERSLILIQKQKLNAVTIVLVYSE